MKLIEGTKWRGMKELTHVSDENKVSLLLRYCLSLSALAQIWDLYDHTLEGT